MDTKFKLTGLWSKETKNGEQYLSGDLGPTARILVFKNSFKQGDREPDWVLYLAPADAEQKGGQGPRSPRQPPYLGEEFPA